MKLLYRSASWALFLLSLLFFSRPFVSHFPSSSKIWALVCKKLPFERSYFQEKESLPSMNWDEKGLNPLSIKWIQKLLKEFPELSWYVEENQQSSAKNEEKEPSFSWSRHIFDTYCPEFDRTVLRIWSLRAFYNGSKEAWHYFVQKQPVDRQLRWESFCEIHQTSIQLTESHPWMTKEEALLALETYLILAELGKTAYGQNKAQEQGLYISETKDFFKKTLESCPQIYPSLKRLPYPYIELIKRTAYPLHMGHLLHLEADPTVFRPLVESRLLQNNPSDFEFFYFVDLCATAAFLGQRSLQGSLFLDERLYRFNILAKEAAENTLQLDYEKAYMLYFKQRADSLGLSVETKQERVLTRIGAMLSLSSLAEGTMLKKAVQQLDLYNQALLLSQLDIHFYDSLKRTPHYIPALLKNILDNPKLGAEQEERIGKVFILALPFISEVLQSHRRMLNLQQADPNASLDFNRVASKVADNPYMLNYVVFQIDEKNKVLLE